MIFQQILIILSLELWSEAHIILIERRIDENFYIKMIFAKKLHSQKN
jgi:hypothetical protein